MLMVEDAQMHPISTAFGTVSFVQVTTIEPYLDNYPKSYVKEAKDDIVATFHKLTCLNH